MLFLFVRSFHNNKSQPLESQGVAVHLFLTVVVQAVTQLFVGGLNR